ncbi:MAG: type III pantothenate kinase [Spirochaetes bacterium]|nr:type III pantothenate kinase [Spirochaetota bacterium]
MLLAIDIGNTNIVIGVFQDKTLLDKWRISTQINKTEDEYMSLLDSYLNKKKYHFHSGIISSVVPSLDKVFENLFKKMLRIKPIIVSHKLNLGIHPRYKNPDEIGADRLVNAAAACKLYSAPLIIIDFGTAITVCYVDKDNIYHGGLILPGINLMRHLLHSQTAKLPEVEIVKPDWIIGENTEKAIQAGLFYQTAGSMNYIIDLLLKKYDKKSKIILTGGQASLFNDHLGHKTIIEHDLTLKGLQIIFSLNTGG